jgi:hypothetical protein
MLLAGYGLKIPEIIDLTGRLVQALRRKLSHSTGRSNRAR